MHEEAKLLCVFYLFLNSFYPFSNRNMIDFDIKHNWLQSSRRWAVLDSQIQSLVATIKLFLAEPTVKVFLHLDVRGKVQRVRE